MPAFAQLRFATSGSEAVQAAVRTARTATGRSLILMFSGHYHGWLDGLFRGTDARPSEGIPDAASSAYLTISWNDFDAVRDAFMQAGEEIAAVLMEPLPCNAGIFAPRVGFLEYVRDLAHSSGALVIFDEVITGFRVDLAGVQGVSGVTPDLAIVSKAMANGYPISAFGGTRDVMRVLDNRRTIHGGTFNGGGVSVAAASATITRLTALGPPLYERLTVLGQQLMKGICRSGARAGVSVEVAGPGPVFHVWFSDAPVVNYLDHLSADREKYARFAARLFDCGIWVLPSGRWHLSAAHSTDHVSETLQAVDSAFQLLVDAY
jgi:glutamate-1-semialdehyde 2,1-aminomutase